MAQRDIGTVKEADKPIKRVQHSFPEFGKRMIDRRAEVEIDFMSP